MKKSMIMLSLVLSLLSALAFADIEYDLTSSNCQDGIPTTYLFGTWTSFSGCQMLRTSGFNGYHCAGPDRVSDDCNGTRCYYLATLNYQRFASTGCPPGTVYTGPYTTVRICD